MSQSTNQKYDDLLNKFLQNDNLIEKNGSKELERWLFEAENNIRSQSQSHQGKTKNKFILLAIKYMFR